MRPEKLIQQQAESALQHRTSRRGLFRGAGKGAAGLALGGVAASLGALLFSSCYPGRSNAITGKAHAVLAARRDGYRDWTPIPYGDAPVAGVEWVKLQGDAASVFAQVGNPDRYAGETYRTSQICDLAPMSTAAGQIAEVTAQYPGSYAIATKFQHKDTNEVVEEIHYVDVRPRTPLFPQRGAAVGPYSNEDLEMADRVLSGLAAHGVNSVAYTVWVEMATRSSNVVTPGFPRDPYLREIIDIAHSKGLHVTVKPHVQIEDFAVPSPLLEPADWELWFASYEVQIKRLASLSQDMSVEIFGVGNELNNSHGQSDLWRALISNVRPLFGGTLTYTTTVLWHEFLANEFVEWDLLDAVGSNYYVPGSGNGLLSENDGNTHPTVEEMAENMRQLTLNTLLPRLQSYGKPVIIPEFGMRAYDGYNSDPAQLEVGDHTDRQEQADYAEAVLRFVGDSIHLEGVYYQLQNMDDTYEPGFDYNLLNNPVKDAIRLWYA